MKLLERWLPRRRPSEPEHLRQGRLGEVEAYKYLRRVGYTVVGRNFRTPDGRGEIDLIGWDGEQLAFVEVKTRASDEFGAPVEAIDHEKRRRLVRAAGVYLRRAGLDWSCARFDAVSVIRGETVRIELFKDLFSPREATRGER